MYPDDVFVAGIPKWQQSANPSAFFDRPGKDGVTTKTPKCGLGKPSIIFLGYIVSSSGIAPSPDKATAIRYCPAPRSYRQLRQFFHLVNFNWRSIVHCAKTITPLAALQYGAPLTYADTSAPIPLTTCALETTAGAAFHQYTEIFGRL